MCSMLLFVGFIFVLVQGTDRNRVVLRHLPRECPPPPRLPRVRRRRLLLPQHPSLPLLSTTNLAATTTMWARKRSPHPRPPPRGPPPRRPQTSCRRTQTRTQSRTRKRDWTRVRTRPPPPRISHTPPLRIRTPSPPPHMSPPRARAKQQRQQQTPRPWAAPASTSSSAASSTARRTASCKGASSNRMQ